MNQDDLAAAERILEQDPDSLAFARLASMYLEQDDTEKAKTICLQGIEAHPFYVNGYIILAKCHRTEGAVQEARRGLKRALRLDPDNLMALWELARINEEEGRTSLVVRNLTRILQREPLNDTVWDELVRLGEDIASGDTEEMEPLISETMSIEESIKEMTEDVDILAADEEEHVPSLPDEEAADREAGWELLDQIQKELAEETETAPVADEIESVLEQETVDTSERIETEPIPSELSELLFEDQDQPEQETAPSSEEQDDELTQLLQSIETQGSPLVIEEEVGEDREDVSTSVQSSLDEILGSLGGTDAEEPAEQDVEEVEVPPVEVPHTEETPAASSEETAVSASESDELLSLLGQISDQQKVEVQEEGDTGKPAEESSETASRGDLPVEPLKESQLPSGRKAISSSESNGLLSLLGQISDQQEPQIQDEQGPEGQSEDPIITATLADIYANQGMVDKAIQILEEALRIRPDDLHIQNRLTEIKKSAEGTRGQRTGSSTKEE